MNSTQEKLIKIEEAIREVCPELYNNDYLNSYEDPQLQHILRAIGAKSSVYYSIDTKGTLELFSGVAQFDLTLPLHLQSDEFISWLYGVLVGE